MRRRPKPRRRGVQADRRSAQARGGAGAGLDSLAFHFERKMKIRKKSLIVIRSILIDGHKTSVSVEDAFWNRFKKIAADRHMTPSDLATTINSKRKHNNLSSAIRLFVLDHYCREVAAKFRLAAERRRRVVRKKRD
jgi:predicted DNA-binding ribbon-helix-helix protein